VKLAFVLQSAFKRFNQQRLLSVDMKQASTTHEQQQSEP
jgi:hypothetical protein